MKQDSVAEKDAFTEHAARVEVAFLPDHDVFVERHIRSNDAAVSHPTARGDHAGRAHRHSLADGSSGIDDRARMDALGSTRGRKEQRRRPSEIETWVGGDDLCRPVQFHVLRNQHRADFRLAGFAPVAKSAHETEIAGASRSELRQAVDLLVPISPDLSIPEFCGQFGDALDPTLH